MSNPYRKEYNNVSVSDGDLSFDEGWSIIRNDPEGTEGNDELVAVVNTEHKADLLLELFNGEEEEVIPPAEPGKRRVRVTQSIDAFVNRSTIVQIPLDADISEAIDLAEELDDDEDAWTDDGVATFDDRQYDNIEPEELDVDDDEGDDDED